MALLGMRAVALAVHDVVDDVDAARDGAEGREPGRGEQPAIRRLERSAEEKRQGQDEVLDPLLRAGPPRPGRATEPSAGDPSAGTTSPDDVAAISLILND